MERFLDRIVRYQADRANGQVAVSSDAQKKEREKQERLDKQREEMKKKLQQSQRGFTGNRAARYSEAVEANEN